MGRRGAKNCQKLRDVIYGQPIMRYNENESYRQFLDLFLHLDSKTLLVLDLGCDGRQLLLLPLEALRQLRLVALLSRDFTNQSL